MDTRSRGLDHPLHDVKPGDWIYIKSFTGHPLGEKWKGRYQTLLMTYTAVKARGITTWLHYSKIKKAPTPEKSTATWKAELIGPTSVHLRW
uniref:Murine leukemia virus integrase C-terminal domain-containing protein n=1 Tax=Strigops habroptila TaxID=2489341 RepID=A0A672TGS0_STRHB